MRTLRLATLLIFAALAAACASSGPIERRVGGVGTMERGEASWYGEKFQGRTTACGEKFDQRKLTAAHPTLRCGSVVRVTALKTGKQVNVRINDHFPGTRGRVIDLSEAAFATLAPKSLGVIDVTVEVISTPRR